MYCGRIEALEACKLFSITDWIIDPIAAVSPAVVVYRAAIVDYADEVAAPLPRLGQTTSVGNSSLKDVSANMPLIVGEADRRNQDIEVENDETHAFPGEGKLLDNLLTSRLVPSDAYFANFSDTVLDYEAGGAAVGGYLRCRC
jgi:hypothetical protein